MLLIILFVFFGKLRVTINKSQRDRIGGNLGELRYCTRVSFSTTNDMPHIQSLGVGDLSLFFFPFLFLEVQVRA